ncbi:hypothetical protein P4E94_19000 [Pontiellaceae bacterium B12219]|nr:hypothetical protein [Pontiellaceae bacterium B12219]
MNERHLTRAIYSLWDIQQALSALTFLMEDCDLDSTYSTVELRRFRCYESTLIISLARPFEGTRSGTSLSLKRMGIKLSPDEKELLKKVMHLRRAIIAHSGEEEMHFRVHTFPVLDGQFNVPHFQFNEGLHLSEEDHLHLERFLHRLIQGITKFFFEIAQSNPSILDKYKVPESLLKEWSNQRVEPTVKTPVESGNEQGTAAHS